jgi:SAM-dependent methyltransferase
VKRSELVQLMGEREPNAALCAALEKQPAELGTDGDRAAREVARLEARVTELEQSLEERDAELARIYGSHGWKALLVYYRIRNKVFPPNSKRRILARLVFNFALDPRQILSHLTFGKGSQRSRLVLPIPSDIADHPQDTTIYDATNELRDSNDAGAGSASDECIDYDRRMREEIERFSSVEEVHDLPRIYHVWSERYVLPKLQACGFQGVEDFFLRYIVRACAGDPKSNQWVVSLGSGNCDLEVRLAQCALERGVSNFRFRCVEVNGDMLDRARQLAATAGVARYFVFEQKDVGDWEGSDECAVCMANHSLHHIVALERVFEEVKRLIGQRGVFLANDMIGRNGHTRWPEALELVRKVWSGMPARYKYNHQLRRVEMEFENWDCSKEGNEGIRAQDILPLLLKHFSFEVFVAFANVIDVFVDRGFGPNFDPEREEDKKLILEIAELDEANLDAGVVKPTHMIAAMRATPVPATRVYRHWRPDFCVRWPDGVSG